MLTSRLISTLTAPDHTALLGAGVRASGTALADTISIPSIGLLRNELTIELTIEHGGIARMVNPLDAPPSGMPLFYDGGCLAMPESNWSRALTTFGLK
jgi:hypothetical protein